jgi:hypothetical protein
VETLDMELELGVAEREEQLRLAANSVPQSSELVCNYEDHMEIETDCWKAEQDQGPRADDPTDTQETDTAEVLPAEELSSDCLGSTPCRRHIFPFMSIPSEIRLIIYRMALFRDTPVLFHVPRPRPEKEPAPGTPTPISRSTQGDRTSCLEDSYYTDTVPVQKPHEDPLIPALLLVSKQVHTEAKPVLYSENAFVLQLDSAVYSLMKLRQPTRSLIKHIYLTVPSHHHVLEGFADLVRLGLRYCWGLKTFTIALPSFLPRDREVGSSGTNVYANAFHILRWLPQSAKVILDGGATEEIRKVVEENGHMAESLDRVGHHLVRFPKSWGFDWM